MFRVLVHEEKGKVERFQSEKTWRVDSVPCPLGEATKKYRVQGDGEVGGGQGWCSFCRSAKGGRDGGDIHPFKRTVNVHARMGMSDGECYCREGKKNASVAKLHLTGGNARRTENRRGGVNVLTRGTGERFSCFWPKRTKQGTKKDRKERGKKNSPISS